MPAIKHCEVVGCHAVAAVTPVHIESEIAGLRWHMLEKELQHETGGESSGSSVGCKG
jgi:hypothetical protein